MKKLYSIISIVLCLSILLSCSAFAAAPESMGSYDVTASLETEPISVSINNHDVETTEENGVRTSVAYDQNMKYTAILDSNNNTATFIQENLLTGEIKSASQEIIMFNSDPGIEPHSANNEISLKTDK